MQSRTCFASPLSRPTPSIPRSGLQAVCGNPPCTKSAPATLNRRARVSMGLFGLGFPELAVIAGVGIFIFGPSKVAEMGKELGGFAGGVKKATAEFREAMEESLEEADREIERKKQEKESGKPKAEAVAKSTDSPSEPTEG